MEGITTWAETLNFMYSHFGPSELVMIVKPRNLQRVNPILRSSAPTMDNDPGHMLRESLTSLKVTLSSGKGLLHFDVSAKIS